MDDEDSRRAEQRAPRGKTQVIGVLACSATSVLNSNVSCSSSNTVAVSAGQLLAIHVTAAGSTPTPGSRIMTALRCQ